MLEVRDVSKSYGGVNALSSVSFAVEAGEVVGYLGPNGAGKSTTVKVVTGMIEPTSGDVFFMERSIKNRKREYQASIGYVPEEPFIYQHLSGLEHLQLVGRLRNMEESQIHRRANALLEVLHLGTSRHSQIGSYSKGMKQRILIAGSLIHNPSLLIFDEPLSGLDVTTANIFRHLLVELAAAGKAVLYISHQLEVVEQICKRVIILKGGVVSANGSPEYLMKAFGCSDLNEVFIKIADEPDAQRPAKEILEIMCSQ